MSVIVNSRSGKKSLLVKVLSVCVCVNSGLSYGTCNSMVWKPSVCCDC